MPEFFIELFSEEIPARMQAKAADDLSRLVGDVLGPLAPQSIRTFYGPRRLALTAMLAAEMTETRSVERGPRKNAPDQALAGFLRKHNASREQLREEGDFLVLEKVSAGIDAATLIAREMPPLLRRFPWPKSMRWGGTSQFTWVRPLRRITCLLDGEIVPFDLRDGADDGHGLASSNTTEGHRFLSPGPVSVASFDDWADTLAARHVVADPAERRRRVVAGIERVAAARQLKVVEDPGLVDEVTGLVEWPVAMIGRIDDAHLDLPAEVMQVSMRVNQRYFALRGEWDNLLNDHPVAPYFAFIANTEGADGGTAIVAGNERVLRARFSDARHFYELDKKQKLEDRVSSLASVTFHAKLGTQLARVERLQRLAVLIAEEIHATTVERYAGNAYITPLDDDLRQASRAAYLSKADLTTGMVAEFPELQGVMGAYYAKHDAEEVEVQHAIRHHYSPKGPSDGITNSRVANAVALADKIDQLAAFFSINEKPTGSSDPFALRRAALGIIRIIRETNRRIRLLPIIDRAVDMAHDAILAAAIAKAPGDYAGSRQLRNVPGSKTPANIETLQILEFLRERLRIQLRTEGARYDELDAALFATYDDDIFRILRRIEAVAAFAHSDEGTTWLVSAKRTLNILRIEEKKDGPHDCPVDPGLLTHPEESALFDMLVLIEPDVFARVAAEDFTEAMASLATLRPPLDAFFDKVTVNDPHPDLRRNRLSLLARVRAAMNLAADFSKIEG